MFFNQQTFWSRDIQQTAGEITKLERAQNSNIQTYYSCVFFQMSHHKLANTK